MTVVNGRVRRDALGLLLAGYTPEEVEGVLAGTLPHPDEPTSLSDPTNVRMKEVPVTHSRARGPVEILGVTTRTNTSESRTCASDGTPILVGQAYERVARMDGRIESYSLACFEEEFGQRELYGD